MQSPKYREMFPNGRHITVHEMRFELGEITFEEYSQNFMEYSEPVYLCTGDTNKPGIYRTWCVFCQRWHKHSEVEIPEEGVLTVVRSRCSAQGSPYYLSAYTCVVVDRLKGWY